MLWACIATINRSCWSNKLYLICSPDLPDSGSATWASPPNARRLPIDPLTGLTSPNATAFSPVLTSSISESPSPGGDTACMGDKSGSIFLPRAVFFFRQTAEGTNVHCFDNSAAALWAFFNVRRDLYLGGGPRSLLFAAAIRIADWSLEGSALVKGNPADDSGISGNSPRPPSSSAADICSRSTRLCLRTLQDKISKQERNIEIVS